MQSTLLSIDKIGLMGALKAPRPTCQQTVIALCTSAPRWRKTQAPSPRATARVRRRGVVQCGLLFVTRDVDEHGARQVLRVQAWRL